MTWTVRLQEAPGAAERQLDTRHVQGIGFETLKGGRWFVVLIVAAACGAAVGRPLAAEAADGAGIQIERVAVGWGDHLKLGRWTPVVVDITAKRPQTVELLIRAPDPDGCDVAFLSPPTELAEAGRHRLQAVFRVGRQDANLRIELRSDGQARAARSVPVSSKATGLPPYGLRQSVHLVATLGRPAGFSELAAAAALQPREMSRRIVVTELDGPGDLPQDHRAYDGLDALVVAGNYDLTELQSAALRDWVRLGGHLVVAVGRRLDAFRASPLASWVGVPLPPQPGRERELTGLEGYTGTKTRIPFLGSVTAVMLDPAQVSGRVLAPGLRGTVLVRVPHGFGRVTFLGLDLDGPPLSRWKALPVLCRKLVDLREEHLAADRSVQRGGLAHSGVTDLATQLQAVLEDFSEVNRSSSWLVMGLMALYLALIGPADYLLVHRVLKRPQLTWLTLPTAIVAVGVAAAWGARATNGEQTRINQLDLVDIDGGAAWMRTRSWAAIYSGASTRHEVRAEPRLPASGPTAVHVSWYGIPEEGFGGMYRSRGLEFGQSAYRVPAEPGCIQALPISLWSTRLVATEWIRTGGERPLVESDLSSTGAGDLQGSFAHHLPGPVSDWMIAYGNRVYRPAGDDARGPSLAELEPGRWYPLQRAHTSRRELRGFLTGMRQRVVKGQSPAEDQEIVLEQTRYDPQLRDAAYVLRMVTFYTAAGGESYTGLSNGGLRELDLSALLELDRAVLFGRMASPATRYRLDGGEAAPDRRETLVRIVLPVRRAPDEGVRRGLLDLRSTSEN